MRRWAARHSGSVCPSIREPEGDASSPRLDHIAVFFALVFAVVFFALVFFAPVVFALVVFALVVFALVVFAPVFFALVFFALASVSADGTRGKVYFWRSASIGP